MIISEKSHQVLSHYIQFLFKIRFELNEKGIISFEKMRNSSNYIYDYAHSFFGKDFQFKSLYWYYNFDEYHHETIFSSSLILLLFTPYSSFVILLPVRNYTGYATQNSYSTSPITPLQQLRHYTSYATTPVTPLL